MTACRIRSPTETGPGATEVVGAREAADRDLFDAIATRLAAKDLAASARVARRRRIEQTISAVPVAGFDRVLEIGCGAGFGALYLRGRYRRYVGIDHSRRLIEIAEKRNSSEDARFEAIGVDEFEPRSPFDLIFMIGVLHHLADTERLLQKMVRWLEPGGYLLANEPQPANRLVRVARRLRTRWDASYSSDQEEISADRLRTLFEGAGLEAVTIRAQGFLSTPFAEVVLKPSAVMTPLAYVACAADGVLERLPGSWAAALSWNLIGCGRTPTTSTG